MKIEHTKFEAQHPWPEGMFIQGGGHGVVFVKNGKSYGTAFVEAFPEDTFIRGEGDTVLEAEDAAWAKYQKLTGCPGHEYEARGYTNGGGFCKHCNSFGSKVFTPEEVGCFCATCGVPTFWSRQNDEMFCEIHATDRDTEWLRQHQPNGELNTTGSQLGDLFAYLTAAVKEDQE